MDVETRERVARQGLSTILANGRCPECGYAAPSSDVFFAMMVSDYPCPHCGITGLAPRGMLAAYPLLLDWIGEYAISPHARDHCSAVILTIALGEALEGELVDSFLRFHPTAKTRFPAATPRVAATLPSFTEVFGPRKQLFDEAPASFQALPLLWKQVKGTRNAFLHGHSSNYAISQADAFRAMDVATLLWQAFIGLNNTRCIARPGGSAGGS